MDAKTGELMREFVAKGGNPEDWWKSWHGSYSIAPPHDAPIVRDRGEGRFLELVRWDWLAEAAVPAEGRPDHQRSDREARHRVLNAGVYGRALRGPDAWPL